MTDVRGLVAKYRTNGPRYTSYPTAAQFEPLDETLYRERLAEASTRVREPWSLYVHVPFCRQRCTFCACAVIATKHHDRVAPRYVDWLRRELDLVSGALGSRRRVAQLHWGGGTPTYLQPELLAGLYAAVRRHFEFAPSMESSIEVDPRVTTSDHLDVLAACGVNRISMGVQDLDVHVQSLIGRHQSEAQTRSIVDGARRRGILQTNIDLVYGLPGQTEAGLLRTVDAVIDMQPGRVALYGYAHVPWMRGHQKRIDPALLPDSVARLSMFLAARERFEAAGYVAIGMDHFARPEDPLAAAACSGGLRRNFMGYTVAAGSDLLGLGVTAIGDVGGALVQNASSLAAYERALAAGRLPIERGLARSAEDLLRHHVIAELMCRHRLCKSHVQATFAIADFDAHFAEARQRLRELVSDGLVVDAPDELVVTDRGRPFVRNVAMAFDAYLPARPFATSRHSATV